MDDLPALLERVADDGAQRATLTAEAARTRAGGLRRRHRVGAVLGSAALVAGILGGVLLVARPDSRTGPAPTAAGAPAATTAPAAAPARVGGVPCRRPTVAGDVDGDCKADRVSVQGTSLVVQGTRAGRLVATIPAGDQPSVAQVSDVDSDGFAEVWVRLRAAGNGGTYVLARYDNHALTVLRDRDGQPVRVDLPNPPVRTAVVCVDGVTRIAVARPARVGPYDVVLWQLTVTSQYGSCR